RRAAPSRAARARGSWHRAGARRAAARRATSGTRRRAARRRRPARRASRRRVGRSSARRARGASPPTPRRSRPARRSPPRPPTRTPPPRRAIQFGPSPLVFARLRLAARNLRSERQISGRRARAAIALIGVDRALRDPPLVHLVRAVGEARPTRLGRHLRERRVGRIAERAVHLDRAVD